MNIIEEYKLYSEQGNQLLQEVLQIASSVNKLNQDRHTKRTTTDSIYIAINKKKISERKRQENNGKALELSRMDEGEHNESPSDEESQSSASSLDYEYSSDEADGAPILDPSVPSTEFESLSLNQANHVILKTDSGAKTRTKQKKSGSNNDMVRQLGTPPSFILPLQNPHMDNENSSTKLIKAIDIPTAVLFTEWQKLSSSENRDISVERCQEFLKVSNDILHKNKPVVVLLLRSGRFAGAVFQGNKCVVHRACQRYTVRRGQGGAQNSNDNAKGKAKSMGAQLRRDGEKKLKRDVLDALMEWKQWIDNSCIVFISCPKTMTKIIFEDSSCLDAKEEGRIRKVPLSVGRPSYEATCAVHSILMTITVKEVPLDDFLDAVAYASIDDEDEVNKIENSKSNPSAIIQKQPQEKNQPEHKIQIIIQPLTPLHEAAAASDVKALTQLHENSDINVDAHAGEFDMTPLHYAAASSSPNAPESIKFLLIHYHANPCLADSRNRVPYYLATNDKNRDAFRLARSSLGEDYCEWDKVAKVGPPLTADDISKRKEKIADKKRQKRQRQKEKKTQERQQQQEQERLEQEEKERKQKEEEAKRVRAGLKPKIPNVENACDFCQKPCKKRSQMFQRLDFYYCSTDCVKQHQRELMAAAAQARFGGA